MKQNDINKKDEEPTLNGEITGNPSDDKVDSVETDCGNRQRNTGGGNPIVKATSDSPIDIVAMIKKIRHARRQYLIVLPIVLVGTYLLTLCVPRYYKCTLELAPEGSGSSSSSSLTSLASSFGLGNLGKLGGNEDAISPLLYPDLLKSPNFVVNLFPIQVRTKDGTVATNYYDYMKRHQKAPFWIQYILAPIKEFVSPTKVGKPFKGTEEVDVRHLDKIQQDVANAIIGNLSCSVNKKTDAITITVKDQDPEVCATIGDSVLGRMQRFIVDYRTKKARNDYAYFKKLSDDAKRSYEDIRRNYARKSDANMDVTLKAVNSEIEDMENEMQLRYNTYTALATQAQAAQAKIQENTPAFTAITTATVPIKPAGPKRTIISLAVTMLAALIITVRVLMKD